MDKGADESQIKEWLSTADLHTAMVKRNHFY